MNEEIKIAHENAKKRFISLGLMTLGPQDNN